MQRLSILRRVIAALGLAALAVSSAGLGESTPNPWALLSTLREHLSEAPQSAAFVQFFRPAGFAGGESENGRVSFSLPVCLRWDYEDPYPKTFLLCEQTIHTWNVGESVGRQYHLDTNEEPGLDLLRLQVEQLSQRYEARVVELPEDGLEVVLTPRSAQVELVEARLTVARTGDRLLALAYEDREGNTTRFDLDDYRPLVETDRFAPPEDIEWLD